MRTKSTNELLKFILDFMQSDKFITVPNQKILSLCRAVDDACSDYGLITYYEFVILKNYMQNHHPDIEHYYDCDNNPTTDNYQFWYPPDQLQPRIDWLIKHIELTK